MPRVKSPWSDRVPVSLSLGSWCDQEMLVRRKEVKAGRPTADARGRREQRPALGQDKGNGIAESRAKGGGRRTRASVGTLAREAKATRVGIELKEGTIAALPMADAPSGQT